MDGVLGCIFAFSSSTAPCTRNVRVDIIAHLPAPFWSCRKGTPHRSNTSYVVIILDQPVTISGVWTGDSTSTTISSRAVVRSRSFRLPILWNDGASGRSSFFCRFCLLGVSSQDTKRNAIICNTFCRNRSLEKIYRVKVKTMPPTNFWGHRDLFETKRRAWILSFSSDLNIQDEDCWCLNCRW